MSAALRPGMEVERIGKLSFRRADCIGSGRYGKVFHGKYSNAVSVAIKRIEKERTRLLSNYYLRANGHPNIVQYFATKDKDYEFM